MKLKVNRQKWGHCFVLTSGPKDKRLCTECGQWLNLDQFTRQLSRCNDCHKAICRARVAASRLKKRSKRHV